MQRVVVTARQARSLAAGHPWILPEGLAEGRRGLVQGTCAALFDGQGRALGTALASPGEPVALRLWSREGETLSREGVLGRVAAAWRRRASLRSRGDTDAYRLVHAEGDALPGLVAEAWGPWISVQVQTAAWDPWMDAVLDALERLAKPEGILLEGKPARGKLTPPEVEVRESGLRYRVRPSDPKPGLFPDERENRAWLAPRCKGKTVLNAFAFTGAFTVAAARAGAASVTSLDLSAPVLKRLEANLLLNGIDPERHLRVRGEAQETMGRWAREGRRFDLVILDPPAYATHRGGRWQAARDYPALAQAACRLLAPGGLLAAALTVQDVTPEGFERLLARGVEGAGRKTASLERRGPPEDFPQLPAFPEGSYLKFAALRVD